jgi:DNA-binding NarL/FixJ family response regulator
MTHATIALVITQPGPLHHSLMVLLSTMPEIEIVAEARDLSTLKRLSKDWQPDLILIEAGVAEKGLPETLQQINQTWTHTRAIVLVDEKDQQQKAEAAGADAVLQKGFRATRLIEVIEELLHDSTPEDNAIIV